MKRLPSFTTCIELLVLRRRLPRLFEQLPLDTLLARLEPRKPRRRRVRRDVLERSIALTERVITRHDLAPDTCLYRALGRYALLRANGVPASFCLGVQPPPDGATGHAWVEDETGPYLDEIEDGEYVVTFARTSGARPSRRSFEPRAGATQRTLGQ